MADETNKPQEASAPETKKPAKKKGKKIGIAVIVVAIVAIAGVGFNAWHETPGFCAAICHNMDEYLYTYSEPQNAPGVDKYGNVVTNTNAMMATLHRENDTTAMSEIRCMDCHHAIIGEQVTEGTEFITGNYPYPLSERNSDGLTKWWGEPGTNFCSNQNCHTYLLGNDNLLDYDKLEASTSWMEFNPHSQHHENLNLVCTDCHKGHRASTVVCTGCHEHEDITLPDGWITYQQSQELMQNEFDGDAAGFVGTMS